jgi:hypothetical protein
MIHVKSVPFTLGRLVALAAVFVGLLIAGAGTASADLRTATYTERFESSHSDLRFINNSVGGSAGLVINRNPLPVINPQRARSGVGHALLSTGSYPGYAGVERTIHQPAYLYQCRASAWVNPEGARTVRFEGLDQNRIRLWGVDIPLSGSSYQQINIHFHSPTANLPRATVRVGLLARTANKETLRIDDLSITCYG